MTNGDPWIGKQVGNYRIVEIINSGAFGSVYKGKHLFFEHDPIVAIKVPRTTIPEEERHEFIKEAQLQRQLRNPHILTILDAGFQNGIPYIVTMFAAGGSLRGRLSKLNGQPLPLEEALLILTQVGQALHFAHQYQQSVVHRDLKPENILFDEKGHVLLADFGIAVLLSSIRTGFFGSSGTPPYMAPEQFEGLASSKSDQYALGCIAYELVTGRKVFSVPNPSLEAWWYHHSKVEPVPPRRYNPQLPASIEQAILIAISKNRLDRHSDIAAFIQMMKGTWEQWIVEGDIPFETGYLSSTSTKPSVGTTLLSYRGHSANVMAISWSPDGNRIASGAQDKTVQVWDAVTGHTLLTYRGHTDRVHTVTWSPDGSRIASSSAEDKTVQVWDAASGQVSVTYPWHADWVYAVAWAPDGRYIVSSAENVHIWDALTSQTLMTYSGHTGPVEAVAWSPDGSRIASGAREVQVWDAITGQTLITYDGHDSPVETVTWSPDSRHIASFAFDHSQVQVWDAATGQVLVTYSGNAASVEAITWSPDGRCIASSGEDKTVQVWNAATGETLMAYFEHHGKVEAVAWSPDGSRIASGSFEVNIWQVE
jgi:WD40 repeat protein